MIIAHLRTFLISAFFVSSITSLAAQDAPSQAEKSASLIRAKQYPAAIQSLSGNLTKMAADDPAFTEDQLMLLKARALHLHKQHADSAKVCKELLQKFPASKWQHKTRFLMAHTHAARGDYQTALSIYEKESTRLFSAKRKDEVARSLIEFADLFAKVPSPEDLDAPKPDFKKAYNLYKEVLDLNCSPALKEQAHFLMVRMSGLLGDWATASKDATTYLSQYDPSWRGVLLSKQRLTFQKNTTAKLTGKHRSEVRYRMAEALHRSNSRPQAVRYLDELMAMLADGSHKAPDGLAADAAWLKLMAMRQQGGRSQDVNHWVTAAKAYLKTYPTHIHASRTALLIPEMLASHNEPQKAIAAYQEYLKTPIKPQEKPLTLETETRSQFLTRQERAARQMEEASYQIGTLYLRLKQFANARTAWNQTAKDHPNGARWADSQKGIIDVDFEEAMEAIRSIHAGPENNKSQAAKRASELLKKFNQAHPLSDQAPNILFLLGRIPHQLALDMDASEKLTEAQSAEQKTLFKQAITVWDDLLSKYPKSTHSTLAKEHIGIIYEQRLGDLEKALSVYKQTKSATASARYSVLTAKRLIASSPKVFRTDEKPVISLSLRNIEKVTVRQYWLDLESYFRKARKLGNISELDVDLVEPDKQWDVTIDGYKKYLPLEKEIPAPFDGNKPGVCVVKVEGGGFVSTTVLVRSDIDIAVRSSKDELLALATNWRDGSKPSAGTKLLIADGGKVIASGKTGNDGVLHIKTDQLKNIEDLRVLALSDAGAATCDLNLSSLVAPPMLIEQAWFNTPQAWYRPGETVQLSGIIRIPNNGIYQLPTKDYKQWKLRCLDMNGGKLIHEADITLNDHGSFSIQFAVPQGMSSGKINATLISTNKDKPIEFDTSIAVKNQQRNRVILTMDFPKTWTSPGEKINGKVTAKYHWGAPVSDRQVKITLPNNIKLTVTTDGEGIANFSYDSSALAPGSVAYFSASMPSESSNQATQILDIDPLGFNIEAEVSHGTIASGEAFEVIAKTLLPDGNATARKLTLEVVKQEVQKTNPILSEYDAPELPNAVNTGRQSTYLPVTPVKETIVQTHAITTDPETGLTKKPITLEEGGRFILRLRGKDARGRLVFAESFIEIYGKASEQKIRLLVNKNNLREGGEVKIDAWSRLTSPTSALLSIEADSLIEYKVVRLAPGKTPLTFQLNQRHAPVFRAALMTMHQRKFYSSDDIIPVERTMKIVTQIEGLNQENEVAPGGKLKVKVKVLDGNDQPQDAEVSLALIDHRDAHSSIGKNHFIRSNRLANFVLGTSCGLQHQGRQTAINLALRAEEERLRNAPNQPARRIGNGINAPPTLISQNITRIRKLLYQGEGYYNLGQYDKAAASFETVLTIDRYSKAARRWLERVSSAQSDYYRAAYDQTRAGLLGQVDRAWQIRSRGNGAGRSGSDFISPVGFTTIPGIPASSAQQVTNTSTAGLRSGDYATTRNSIDAILNNPNRNSIDAVLDNRNGRGFLNNSNNANWATYNYRLQGQLGQEYQGYVQHIGRGNGGQSTWVTRLTGSQHSHQPTLIWSLAQQVVSKDGTELEIPLPNKSGSWKLLSRASTDHGNLGQKIDTIHTRLPYDLHLQTPDEVIEGDQLAPVILLTRKATDAAESITLTLSAKAGDKTLTTTTHKLEFAAGESTKTVSTKSFPIPASSEITLSIKGDKNLTLTRALPVRPWGLPVADRASKILTAGNTNLTLTLPNQAKQSTIQLEIVPGAASALLHLATTPQAPWCGSRIPFSQAHPAGQLLAAAAVIDLNRRRGVADDAMRDLIRRANRLAADLAVTRKSNGSWSPVTGRSAGNLDHTAMAFEALSLANKLKLTVDQPTLAVTQKWLEKQQASISSNDLEARSLVQYALSCANAADFSTCNRLFRDRGKLGDAGKALLAATFINLKRPENAKTLLAAMNEPAKWTNKSQKILCSQTYIAARALSAAAMIDPGSKLTASLRNHVLENSGAGGFTSDLERGAALVGLARIEEKIETTDATISIKLNGKEVGSFSTDKPETMANIKVDSSLLVAGKNSLSFSMEGKGQLLAAATLQGFTPIPQEVKIDKQFSVTNHRYYREGLSFQGTPLRARSTSPAKTVNKGERVQVQFEINHERHHARETILIERIPAGFVYESGTLRGNHSGARIENDHLIISFDGWFKFRTFSYSIIARHPGVWRQPPTLFLPLNNPADSVHSTTGTLTVIDSESKNPDIYQMNIAERSELAALYFAQGDYPKALAELLAIRRARPDWEHVGNSRMLLWITSEQEKPDAKLLVESFEILNERAPDLVIPFDKILKVGMAYRELKEYERGLEVFSATIEAGFTKDIYISAALEDQGRFLDAVDYQKSLSQLYPNEGAVTTSWFALAQQLYEKSSSAADLKPRRGEKKPPNEIELIGQASDMLEQFLLSTPESPLADDAAFTMANVLFSLKKFKQVVKHAQSCITRYPESKHRGSFRYMEALASFWMRDYDSALKVASVVAQGSSEDKNLAAYITAQIYHAKGQPLKATPWYERVKDIYPDALESIAYFEQKMVRLDEAKVLKSGEQAKLKLHFRNIKEAHLQIYRVDLMKLYLREKSLSNVANVNLAGIAPKHEMTIKLGKGEDFQDREKLVTLPVKNDGAYLVICRGDYLYTSGLVLITPLKMEVQENLSARSLRVNISDQGTGKYLDNVHVKAIGVRDSKFKSGETDLRGVWKAENITSRPTVIARDSKGRYAFYRSNSNFTPVAIRQRAAPAPSKGKPDFKGNLYKNQLELNDANKKAYEKMRRSKGKGVKAKEAIKK